MRQSLCEKSGPVPAITSLCEMSGLHPAVTSLCENHGPAPLAHARGSVCGSFDVAPNGTPTVTGRAGRRRLGSQRDRPALPVTAGWSPDFFTQTLTLRVLLALVRKPTEPRASARGAWNTPKLLQAHVDHVEDEPLRRQRAERRGLIPAQVEYAVFATVEFR